MRILTTSFLALTLTLTLAAIGCGDDDGTGDRDTGPGDVDSGPADVDSGPADVDAGPGDIDSGPGDVDSGPGDVDSGPGCMPVAEDSPQRGMTCAPGGPDVCPTDYVCEEESGVVLSGSCQIPCAMRDCDCPTGLTCQGFTDKAGTDYHCAEPPAE
jgi:hypothetical protein